MSASEIKPDKRITFVQPKYLNIKKIAVNLDMSITALLLVSLREYLDRRGINIEV